jgi:hypothetical protein
VAVYFFYFDLSICTINKGFTHPARSVGQPCTEAGDCFSTVCEKDSTGSSKECKGDCFHFLQHYPVENNNLETMDNAGVGFFRNIHSPANCQQECASNNVCTHFSYNFENQTCTLKKITDGEATLVYHESAISGPKFCGGNWFKRISREETKCKAKNGSAPPTKVQILGIEWPNTMGEFERQCKQKCTDMEWRKCFGFTILADGRCYRYTEALDLNSTGPQPDTASTTWQGCWIRPGAHGQAD